MTGKGSPSRRAEQAVYIGIGSNLDPVNSILRGVSLLRSRLYVTASSSFYRNPAIHPHPPGHSLPAFINGVVQVRTSLPPEDVKSRCLQEVEQACGRLRTRDRYAPRILDLDLLVYGDLTIRTETLQVPDPDILVHPFLAVPLAELTPDLMPAGSDLPMREIVSRMETGSLKEETDLTRTVRLLLCGRAGNGRDRGSFAGEDPETSRSSEDP